MVGVRVGNDDLFHVADAQTAGRQHRRQLIDRARLESAGVDDGDRWVDQHVAIDRPDMKRGRQTRTADTVGQHVDKRRQHGCHQAQYHRVTNTADRPALTKPRATRERFAPRALARLDVERSDQRVRLMSAPARPVTTRLGSRPAGTIQAAGSAKTQSSGRIGCGGGECGEPPRAGKLPSTKSRLPARTDEQPGAKPVIGPPTRNMRPCSLRARCASSPRAMLMAVACSAAVIRDPAASAAPS